jgi:O-antigen/teichoic acid export membrane protein
MCPKFQKKVIGRGAAYIYIETIASLISGYIFWLIMSKLTSSEVIGTSSTVVTFATIVAVIAGLGITTGMQPFIAKSLSEKKIEDAKIYFISCLLLICIGIFVCCLSILIGESWIGNSFGIDFGLILMSILLIASYNTSTLFRSVVVSSLRTQSLPLIFIMSAGAKLVLSSLLLVLGLGSVGLVIGFTFNYILSSILLAVILLRTIFKTAKTKNVLQNLKHNTKKILLASVVNWVPIIIMIVGSQLGTIVVFGAYGASQAGVYFLALTIVTGITSVMSSLYTIALPTLSSLHDYRKRITWQTIRLSAIIILPFSCSLIFFSNEIMNLFGEAYVNGSVSLEILLMSMLPMCVTDGIYTLAYSYRNYRYVLIVGLAISVPQTILYFSFVPIYGEVGAALAYTVGATLGCVVSIVISKKIGLLLFWKELAIIFMLPTSIGYVLSFLHLNYILGIIFTIVFSYILLLKIRIVTRSDIHDFLDVLPDNISNQIIDIAGRFKKH